MIIYIDIDETICSTKGLDYSGAKPIIKNIKRANKLYNSGHTIVYWTGRGRETGIDWREMTENQFKLWGVRYNKLLFNKPYDIIIDDKAINTKDWKDLEL